MDIGLIRELIEQRRETETLDFKEQYHENKAELIHDILCLANNTKFKDAYIVFGINDKGETVGVENQQNRITLANIQGLLQDNRSKFFNNELPTVDVIRLKDNGHEIDVLQIKSTFNVPFFLVENYPDGKKTIRSGHIYSRSGDRNTPINGYAAPVQTELLWQKRFNLLETPVNRLLSLLDDPRDWIKESVYSIKVESFYYQHDPLYKVKNILDEDPKFVSVYFSLQQIKPTIYLGSYSCYHGDTCIKSGCIYEINEMRTTVTEPHNWTSDGMSKSNIEVDYYLINSIEYKLLPLFNSQKNFSHNHGLHLFFKHILVFLNSEERDDFFTYINENHLQTEEAINARMDQVVYNKRESEYHRKRLATGHLLKESLDEFRKKKLTLTNRA